MEKANGRKPVPGVSVTSSIHGGRPENASGISGTSAIHGGRIAVARAS